MKRLFSLFCCLLALGAVSGRALAAPLRTRASYLGAVAVGMGKIMRTADYLHAYPGSRTAILSYLKMDSDEVFPMVRNLRLQDEIHDKAGREFWPQVALETQKLSLSAFHRELSRRGSQVAVSVQTLAREIAGYKHKKKWFFIRPFSEMNDGTPWAPWEFAHKKHINTPADLAAAWKLLRERFDEEGATNAIFIFSPLAAYSVGHEDQVLKALNSIPIGYIDAFGLNVYSRPRTAYGGKSPDPIPFAELVKPWIALMQRSRHKGLPLAVAEMGISNQANDARRAKWLQDAFQFARGNGFVMLTYFNFPHKYWQIDDGTLAGEALRTEMSQFRPR